MSSNLILTLPPTDNRLRMPVVQNTKARGKPKATLIKTPEYRNWAKTAAIDWEIWRRKQMAFDSFTPTKKQQLQFNYWLFLPNWRTDISNYGKALSDFLGGNRETSRLFTDDHYVYLSLQLSVSVDAKNPRVEIDPIPTVHSLP